MNIQSIYLVGGFNPSGWFPNAWKNKTCFKPATRYLRPTPSWLWPRALYLSPWLANRLRPFGDSQQNTSCQWGHFTSVTNSAMTRLCQQFANCKIAEIVSCPSKHGDFPIYTYVNVYQKVCLDPSPNVPASRGSASQHPSASISTNAKLLATLQRLRKHW